MKINELRIGNYISPLGRGTTVVEGLCIWDGLIQSSNFAERGIEDFEPIPLTEEWLLKFGCIEVYENAFQDVDSTFIVEFKENKFIVYLICPMPWVKLEYIKYVHQLQNLYFALTGEEIY
jgi:hypothetical protein